MDIFFQLAAVTGVLLLLSATLWWLRRRGFTANLGMRRATVRRLQCLERLSLGPHTALHLVRLGDEALLVASSPTGCVLIHSGPCHEIERAVERDVGVVQ